VFRWRLNLIAVGVVLVVGYAVTSYARDGDQPFDYSLGWFYRNKSTLHAVLIVATVVFALAALLVLFHRHLRRYTAIAVGAAVTGIALMVVAERLAGASTASAVAGGLHEVASILPAGSKRTQEVVGSGSGSAAYQVPGDPTAVGNTIEASLRARYGRPGPPYLVHASLHGPATDLLVSFVQVGPGCDGSVDLEVISRYSGDNTAMVEINDRCED